MSVQEAQGSGVHRLRDMERNRRGATSTVMGGIDMRLCSRRGLAMVRRQYAGLPWSSIDSSHLQCTMLNLYPALQEARRYHQASSPCWSKHLTLGN